MKKPIIEKIKIKDKNKIVLWIILPLLVLIYVASYAYFVNLNSAKLSSNIAVANSVNIDYTSSEVPDLYLNIDAQSIASNVNTYSSNVVSSTISLNQKDSRYGNVTCSYLIYYQPIDEFNNSKNAEYNDVELEIYGELQSDPSINFSLDLDNVSGVELLYTGTLTDVYDANLTPKNEIWNFKMNFYSKDYVQNDLIGQNIRGKIKIALRDCEHDGYLQTKAISNSVSLDDYDPSANQLVNLGMYISDTVSMYYYLGSNPNNYICLDPNCTDGLFRIVSLTNKEFLKKDTLGMLLETANISSSNLYAKIIPAEPILQKWSDKKTLAFEDTSTYLYNRTTLTNSYTYRNKFIKNILWPRSDYSAFEFYSKIENLTEEEYLEVMDRFPDDEKMEEKFDLIVTELSTYNRGLESVNFTTNTCTDSYGDVYNLGQDCNDSETLDACINRLCGSSPSATGDRYEYDIHEQVLGSYEGNTGYITMGEWMFNGGWLNSPCKSGVCSMYLAQSIRYYEDDVLAMIVNYSTTDASGRLSADFQTEDRWAYPVYVIDAHKEVQKGGDGTISNPYKLV